MDDLQKLLEKQADLKKEMEVTGKRVLGETFKKIFDKHPQVEAIRWEQYTPYFNDGDACTFGRGEFHIKLAGDNGGGDYEDGYYALHSSELPAHFKKLLQDLEDKFGSDYEDMFEAIFGDHVEVTANRAGFDTSIYDHE